MGRHVPHFEFNHSLRLAGKLRKQLLKTLRQKLILAVVRELVQRACHDLADHILDKLLLVSRGQFAKQNRYGLLPRNGLDLLHKVHEEAEQGTVDLKGLTDPLTVLGLGI